MGCVLHVRGKQFDVDSFLGKSALTPYQVFHIGEPRSVSRPERGAVEASGFSIRVSDASWDGLAEQTADAAAFLDEHKQELERLRSTPGIDDMRLDFPIHLRINDVIAAQFDYFPPELVSRAGTLGIGLELSIYPVAQEQS